MSRLISLRSHFRQLLGRAKRKIIREAKNLLFYRSDTLNLWLWHLIQAYENGSISSQAQESPIRHHDGITKFHVLVLVDSGDTAEGIRSTINSLSEQSVHVSSVCIMLLADSDAATALAVHHFADQHSKGEIEVRLGREFRACESNGWTCILRAGVRLKACTLFRLAAFIQEHPHAKFLYTDEMQVGPRRLAVPFLKPDWSPDLLLSRNYIGDFIVARNDILSQEPFEWSSISLYDIILRLTELAAPDILHIKEILYECPRTVPNVQKDTMALNLALKRRGVLGEVCVSEPGQYQIRYRVNPGYKMSIIIPTKDRIDLLERCIASLQLEGMQDVEVIIIDNDSIEPASHAYFHRLSTQNGFRIIQSKEKFNYSRLNNLAVRHSVGDVLLFMNNDTEILTDKWWEYLLGYVQQPRIGAVGAKLLYPNGRIQHGGDIVGLYGAADHAFRGRRASEPGYGNYLRSIRNVSAVTAAFLMMRRTLFDAIGGFDEALDVAFNDVDLCLRIRQAGYDIVWTPQVEVRHYESASRGHLHPDENTIYFREKWASILAAGDPFYHPALSHDGVDHMLDVSMLYTCIKSRLGLKVEGRAGLAKERMW
ncbi:MAG: glycosyltransferase family 2 protein [Alicyclobacillus sp.]|nr:glycosyltransferase family 2 protein [Alicyclobacillus sp.]